MGIFGRSQRTSDYESQNDVADESAYDAPARPREEEDTVSNVESMSPIVLRMQEKLRSVDNLKSRLKGLNRTFEQMSAAATESSNSIQLLAEFVESSRSQIETEARLKSENAKLSTELIDRNHQVNALATQLEEATAEIHSLRKRSAETRTALENARNDIISIRDNNKKVNEEYRAQSARLVEANAQIDDLTTELKDLHAKHATLETHAETLKAEVESIAKREKELQQNLTESTTLLEREIKKNNAVTNELEAAKREVVEYRNEAVDVKSQLDVANEELDYSKERLEEERRKHDNETYALNAEIENLSSQRRVGAQTLQEVTRENASLKERNRALLKRMQEIEALLDGAQKNHETDRSELVSVSGKLRELNLRYNSVLTDLNHARRQNDKYADNLETLVEENKKLQQYRIRYETANDQIAQLKSVIANYQTALEDEGITMPSAPAVTETEPSLSSPASQEPGDSDDGEDVVVVKLRD